MTVGRFIILTLLILALTLPTCSAQIFVRQPGGAYTPISFSDINRTAHIYWKNETSYERLGLEDLEVEDYHIYVGNVKLSFDHIGTIDGLAAELNSRTLDENIWFINKQPYYLCARVYNSAAFTTTNVATIFNDTRVSTSRVDAVISDATNFTDTGKLTDIVNETVLSDCEKIGAIVDELLDRRAWTNLTAKNYIANKDNDTAQAIMYSEYLVLNNKIDIITFDAPDVTYSLDTSLSNGVNIYDDLTISNDTATITLTLSAAPGVIIADTIYNTEIISSGWVKGAGGSYLGQPAGIGGNGRGGIIIIARNITVGTISANGCDGGSRSLLTNANTDGGDGGDGLFWVISGDSVSPGGDGGSNCPWYPDETGLGQPNGGGGGCAGSDGCPVYTYSGGDSGHASVVTFNSPSELVDRLIKAAVDYWLINVMSKTPTTYEAFPELGGSGGGGGADKTADVSDGGSGGGGGGGGGEIIIIGLNVTAGELSATGGNGGSSAGVASGGGGGSGGVIYVFYDNLYGTNTFNVSGGSAGASSTTLETYPEDGGSGVAKAIEVW